MKVELYSQEEYDLSNLETKGQFSSIATQIINLPIQESFRYCISVLSANPTLAPHVVTIFTQRNDFNNKFIHALISGAQNHEITIFLQWCVSYGIISTHSLNFYHQHFLLDIDGSTHGVKPKILMYHLGNLSLKSDCGVQCENQLYKDFDKSKNNKEISYLLLAKSINKLLPDEAKLLLAFTTNLYLLSPQSYRFIKQFMPSLYSCDTIYSYYTPQKTFLQNLLTWHTEECLQNEINSLLKMKIPKVLQSCIGPIFVTLGGDAAAVIDENTNKPCNLYCYEMLPLDYDLPTIPLKYETFRVGAAPATTRDHFQYITNALATMNIKVMFKAVDGETTMDPWFTEIFNDFLDEETLNLPFMNVVDLSKERTLNCTSPWPVSDLIHLFKCARAHIQGHLTCVDPKHFICVNVQLMEEAANLSKNLENRSSHARMSDQFAFEVFSYQSFISYLKRHCYDAAFYALPFMCLNEATRASFISKKERISFLEIAYKAFKFHLHNIMAYSSAKTFSPSYHKSSIGTLFGDKIFIKRCICTTIALGIGITLDIPRVGLNRIGTHPLEGNFGQMRILQRDNNKVESGIGVAVKTTIVLENNKTLGIETKIRKRVNTGGVKIDWQTYEEEEHPFEINKEHFADVIYNLMIDAPIDRGLLENTIMQLNSYTSRYSLNPTVSISQSTSITSAKPFARYLSINAYNVANTPIPADIAKDRAESLISFYYKKKTINDTQKEIKKANLTNKILDFMHDLISKQRNIPINESLKLQLQETFQKIESLKPVVPRKDAFIKQRASLNHQICYKEESGILIATS